MESPSEREMPSTFQMEMTMVPMSGPQGFYFPYSAMVGGYDMSSFNPQYSQGRISDHEVRAMVNEVNSCSLAKVGSCDPTLWLICIVYLCMLIGIPLYVISVATSVDSSPSITGVIVGFFSIPILGVVVLVSIICMVACKGPKRRRLRQMAISSIVNKHHQQTFAPKQAVAKLSPHGAYLMIQFCWPGVIQAQPQMFMMQAQGQPQMQMFQAQYQGQPQMTMINAQ